MLSEFYHTFSNLDAYILIILTTYDVAVWGELFNVILTFLGRSKVMKVIMKVKLMWELSPGALVLPTRFNY